MVNYKKYVCSSCAGNNKIKDDIFAEERVRKICSYCKKMRNCISLHSLGEAVDDIYRNNYEQSDIGDPPSFIICELLELDESAEELGDDLVNFLSDQESGSEYKDIDPMYDEGRRYRIIPSNENYFNEHKDLWDLFCDRIKHRTRFFNYQLLGWLDRIFLELDKIIDKDYISPIRTMQPTDPDAAFYRARYAANAKEIIKICCHPTQELNSPPSNFASCGRMNPPGISVFYASFDRETCISEIRLPVGEIAISGKFKLVKPITIFDLTVLDKIDYINSNTDYEDREDRIAFLKRFSIEISKPIPTHKEEFEYMPTQALAEYFAYHYKPNIDAIVYFSTQTNGKGKNIVFLNSSSILIVNKNPEDGEYKAVIGNDFYGI